MFLRGKLFTHGSQIIFDGMALTTKLAGIGAIIFGLWMIIFFPYVTRHTTSEMTNLGIVIGIISLGTGLFLLSL